jgi:hypothetical protein
VPSWTDVNWLAEAHAWIHTRLGDVDERVTGDIEQPHVRLWSTVLRVPSTAGVQWFKANAPPLAYEAGVVELLARLRPDLVPGLVATDRERGWMLMADGGERLREIVERERDLDRWLDVLPQYAALQLATAGHGDALVALGTPDRRLAVLPSQYAALVEEVEGLSADQRARLRAHDVSGMCERLRAVGIPETIQHDDLHDGQVFVRDGHYLFFDWADACVSHPFSTMAVTLEGVLSWGLDDVEGSLDVTPFRDAYLQSFASYAGREALEEGHAIALRLGWISRALSVDLFARWLPTGERAEWDDRIRERLRMFAGGSPSATT